ncbi:MAG TPA: hypothetical protein VND15_01210 [Candidatus Acidoferrales bacterium]|nr:hypothetical protein [Candidatus Acidoferrales bacterium]
MFAGKKKVNEDVAPDNVTSKESAKFGSRAARIFAPIAGFIATGTGITASSDMMTKAEWDRLFSYARQHVPDKLSAAVTQSNVADAMNLLRNHGNELMNRMDYVSNIFSNRVIESLQNVSHMVSDKIISMTMTGLNQLNNIANTCETSISVVSWGPSTFPFCVGSICEFQNKLISIAQKSATAMNGSNNIVIQNETVNRMSELCISSMQNLTQHLIMNITTLRV